MIVLISQLELQNHNLSSYLRLSRLETLTQFNSVVRTRRTENRDVTLSQALGYFEAFNIFFDTISDKSSFEQAKQFHQAIG